MKEEEGRRFDSFAAHHQLFQALTLMVVSAEFMGVRLKE
jgi:hypothetical protein